ncbi:hypothetical protein [Hoyosella altamirensis]|uniref:SRPBCC family protein n=1 Tax=Hoyosella altamirensis TaxID=616997 RepID=A0A839RKZ8_9ACTN|nr:hypothetical protein [Hoyosella altamirensis]MBB3037140.1 hypothetical protein [Hoyosella altamirensis]
MRHLSRADLPAARTIMRTIIETFSGIALIKIHVLLGRPLRKWRTTWGTTAAERQRGYPGDQLLPNPSWRYTHAVTIDARPAQVWPWIVQIGQGRGGFYSYEALENLIGCRISNAHEILPQFQDLEVGDTIRLHPKAPPIPVALIEAERHLVLFASDAESSDATVWGFHLVPLDGHRTRLIERGGSTHGDTLRSRLAFGRMLLEPISFVMSRKMLLSIRRLAARDVLVSS